MHCGIVSYKKQNTKLPHIKTKKASIFSFEDILPKYNSFEDLVSLSIIYQLQRGP